MLSVRRLLTVATPLTNRVSLASSNRLPKKAASRARWLNRAKPFGSNPGVRGQLEALGVDETEVQDPEFVENLEKQFWDVEKIQAAVDREHHIEKELTGIFQVKRKQFKEEKSPNMLTWDEKQEIKTLHEKDPQQWTIMKLAFSYPATPSIIKKVLRANYKLRTAAEVDKHDSRVRRNWEAFYKGELHVPDEDLRKHLSLFSNRVTKITANQKELALRTTNNDEDIWKGVLKDKGVFSNIIKSYKESTRSKNSHSAEADQNSEGLTEKENPKSTIEASLDVLYRPPIGDTFVIPRSVQNVTVYDQKFKTLETMRRRVAHEMERGHSPLQHDEVNFVQSHQEKKHTEMVYTPVKDPIGMDSAKILLSECQENGVDMDSSQDLSGRENELSRESNDYEIQLGKNLGAQEFQVPKVSPYQAEEDRELQASFKTAITQRSKVDNEEIIKAVKSYVSSSSDSYPLEISIPKDVWKKGALYRVKDRFYTDDGEFLFRVPGLVKD